MGDELHQVVARSVSRQSALKALVISLIHAVCQPLVVDHQIEEQGLADCCIIHSLLKRQWHERGRGRGASCADVALAAAGQRSWRPWSLTGTASP